MANREQLKYAMERLESIADEKHKKIREDCSTPAVKLTASRFVELARSGKLKLRHDYDDIDDDVASSYVRLQELFDLSPYSKKEKLDTKKYAEKSAKLEAEATRIKDQLMLGDVKVALDLIEKFQNTKF